CAPLSTLFPYTTLFRSADRGSAAEVEVDAVLARVAARLVLVAVVHHELQAIRAPADHLSRGDEGVDVPAHLGAVALVAQGRIGRSEEHTSELQSPDHLV